MPAHRQEDLISRWDFEEILEEPSGEKGFLISDHQKNDGFVSGSASLTDGRFGKGLILDGSGDFLSIPHFRGARSTKNISLSAWIKFSQISSADDSDDATIFSTSGTSASHARLWYDVNTNTAGNQDLFVYYWFPNSGLEPK